MYNVFHYKREKKLISSVLFGMFLGVVLGSVLYYMYLLFSGYDFFDFQEMGTLTGLREKDVMGLTIYVLKKRVILLLLFLLGLSVCPPDFVYSVFFGVLGLFYSLFTCYHFLHYKFLGLLKSYLLWFPHSIFYFLAILVMGSFFTSNDTSCGLSPKKIRWKKFGQILKIFVTIFLLFLGLYFEIHSRKI